MRFRALIGACAAVLFGCEGPNVICAYGASYCGGAPYSVRIPGGRHITQHEGIDFAGYVGAPVISASHGEVISASYGYCGGTVIVKTEIKEDNAYFGVVTKNYLYMRYNHIDPDENMSYGVTVKPGESIGTMQNPHAVPGYGNCIRTPHLHFAMHFFRDGERFHVDPNRYWLSGSRKIVCFEPGMDVPPNKIVAPVPC